jgi:hypothetical protein
VTYGDLERIGQTDHDLAMRVWERVKAAAQRELASGHRAAEAVGAGEGRPWHLARFLAMRASLFEAWRPRDGMEQQLVEQLAQWQFLTEHFLQQMMTWSNLGPVCYPRPQGSEEPPRPPTLTVAEATERSMERVEQFQGLYLRTLKALQEYRRRRPTVVVRSAGQVNIAQQQVNIGSNH